MQAFLGAKAQYLAETLRRHARRTIQDHHPQMLEAALKTNAPQAQEGRVQLVGSTVRLATRQVSLGMPENYGYPPVFSSMPAFRQLQLTNSTITATL